MDLKVVKLAIEAQFKPSLEFYGKQGEIGSKIWEKVYPDWENPDAKRLTFKNLDLKEISLIEFRRVLTIKEDLESYSEKDTPIKNFLEVYNAYITAVKTIELLRLGFRVIGFYDKGLKFEELCKMIQPKVYPPNDSELFKITGQQYEDVGFASVYKRNPYRVRFQSGPVTKDELIFRSQPAFPVDIDDLPEASIFYDVDVFVDKPGRGMQERFCKDSYKIIETDTENFTKYIFK